MTETSKDTIKELISKTQISLILDNYDDIFSDFDPRPYNERTLSEDFLSEAKRAARDKGENLELRFLVPKALQNHAQEELIKRRLKGQFKRYHDQVKKSLISYRNQALLLIIIGTILGLLDALALSAPVTLDINSLLTDVIGIILTPASWFSIWTGLEHLIYRPKGEVGEESFYRKMEKVRISFVPY